MPQAVFTHLNVLLNDLDQGRHVSNRRLAYLSMRMAQGETAGAAAL
jgi:hypothetical protein